MRGTPVERFRNFVAVDDSSNCWLWTGSRNENGYGRFSLNGRATKVHRFAYELFIGPIPDGLTIDHLCRVRHCVNPAHLEVVTAAENIARGMCIAVVNAAKTHCPAGHPYDEINTQRNKHGRHCRECNRQYKRAFRAKATA